MASNMKIGVFAVVATLSCAPTGNGDENTDRGDTPDGGVAVTGTPDGGYQLNVDRLKRLVDGKYLYRKPQLPQGGGDVYYTELTVRNCSAPSQTPEICLISVSGGYFVEAKINLSSWSLQACDRMLSSYEFVEGECRATPGWSGWMHGQIWRCNCDAIARRSPEDEANCRERNDPQWDDCNRNWGVEVFIDAHYYVHRND